MRGATFGRAVRTFTKATRCSTPARRSAPRSSAILASIGRSTVDVYRRPRVAIMGSGDELVDLDRFHEVLAGRKIVSSNGYTLHALVRDAGGEPVNFGVAADDPASLREHLRRAGGCDLVLTSAGVSVGEFDYTREVIQALGAEMKFWRVRMRPGAPLGFGLLGPTPWIGLPGNPVSAMVTFELFVRPVLRRMLGHTRLFRRPIPVGARGARDDRCAAHALSAGDRQHARRRDGHGTTHRSAGFRDPDVDVARERVAGGARGPARDGSGRDYSTRCRSATTPA